MGGTQLLWQKSYIWDIIPTSNEISKFCRFYSGTKALIGKCSAPGTLS